MDNELMNNELFRKLPEDVKEELMKSFFNFEAAGWQRK